MAGYRPKSLDELNSLYDKSLNVKNEIEKKATDLGVKQETYTPAAAPVLQPEEPEADAVSEEAPQAEIAGLVDDFIKNFGTPVSVKKVRPATVAPTTVKAVSSPAKPQAKASVQESAPMQAPYVAERPKLIRNSERNDLFENYKKVMDDEDDDEYSRRRIGRKRGKKLFEKKSAAEKAPVESESAVAEEVQEAPVKQESAYEIEMPRETVEAEISETLENIDAVIEKVLGRPVEAVEAYAQPDESVYEDEDLVQQEEQIICEPEEQKYDICPEEEPEEENFEDRIIQDIQPEIIEDSEAEPVHEAEQEELIADNEDAAAPFEVALPDDEEIIAAPEEEEASGFTVIYSNTEDEYDRSEEEPYEDNVQDACEPEVAAAQEQSYYEDVQETKEAPVKRYAVKNILLAVLLVVILSATAVSGFKAFFGVNSDIPVLGKYHLYSADASYEQGGISKGDLVVVANENITEGDIFAFKKGSGEYSFAKLDGVLNEDSVIADNDGQKSIVFKNTLRGVIYKSYPVVGTVAAMVAANYIQIMCALLIVAAVIILVLLLAFRERKQKAVAEAVSESESAEEYQQEEQYEAIEGDFRYLLQEEEDEFDVYREGYDSQQEGLPVYEGEDYKYEPDEYVKN